MQDDLLKLAWEVKYGPRGGEAGIEWINRIKKMADDCFLEKPDAR